MKDKSKKCEVVEAGNSGYQAIRFPDFDLDLTWIGSDPPVERIARVAQCWNILRTCTDAQLASLERYVDKLVDENKDTGLVIGVHIGLELPF